MKSTFIMGGASFVSILIGLVRTKAVAVLLGPSGVGMIGLLQSLMTTTITIFSLGIGFVGVRQIAEAVAKNDTESVLVVRHAMSYSTLFLGTTGAILFWLLRNEFATRFLHEPAYGGIIGLLGVGVALAVIASPQTAILNGMRRLNSLAKMNMGSAFFSTIISMSALFLWKENGLIIFILTEPIIGFVLGYYYIVKIDTLKWRMLPFRQLMTQWRVLFRLGIAFTISGLALTVAQLLVRMLVQRELGVVALGFFQSAWVISMSYMSLILMAMGTDYFPRLSGAMHDHVVAKQLVNEQTEVALLLVAPILLIILGLAPWIIKILYSAEFVAAADILQWQILGDMFKVLCWPAGFIILAAGDGKKYMLVEMTAYGTYALVVWLGIPWIGLKATGVSFVVMYVISIPYIYWYAYKRIAFVLEKNIAMHFCALILSALVVFFTSAWSEIGAAILGIFTGLMHVIYAFHKLKQNLSFNSKFKFT